MTHAQELGKLAEDIAAEYILSLGWTILARNVKIPPGELDIVAADLNSKPQELIIIEVRCRTIGKIQPFKKFCLIRHQLRKFLTGLQKIGRKLKRYKQ